MKKSFIALTFAIAMLFCFSISIFAAPEDTPSVTKSTAPEVETIEIVDKDGNVVEEVDTGEIIITPVDEANDEDTPEEISERLTDAYEQLEEVDSIADLPGEDVGETIDTMYGEGTADNLVVRELFDLQFSDDIAASLVSGRFVNVRFSTNFAMNQKLVILINFEGNKWMVVPKDRITLNDDGTVSVLFDKAISGPVAFLVEETPVDDGTVVDDGDGDGHGHGHCPCWHCIHIWPCLCRLICDRCDEWPFCPCLIIAFIVKVLIIFTIYKIIKKILKKDDEEDEEKGNKKRKR